MKLELPETYRDKFKVNWKKIKQDEFKMLEIQKENN